jgi:hypothetical protein
LSESKKKKSRFYDFDAYCEVYKKSQRRRGRVGRIIGRFTGFLDGMQGLFVGLLMLPLALGTLLAVVFGASLGPIGFIVILGSIIGGVGLFAEKKVGRSLQFGDYSLVKRAVATAVAFGILMGALFLLLLFHLARL